MNSTMSPSRPPQRKPAEIVVGSFVSYTLDGTPLAGAMGRVIGTAAGRFEGDTPLVVQWNGSGSSSVCALESLTRRQPTRREQQREAPQARRSRIVSDAGRSRAPRLRIGGRYKITKGHVEGRRYRVLVLDMKRKTGDRQVYWAPEIGWGRTQREAAAAWAVQQLEAQGLEVYN